MKNNNLEIIKQSIEDGSNSSFCVLPFIWLTWDQNGAYRLCCEDKGIIHDSMLWSIQKNNILEMRNSNLMSWIRKNMLLWIENSQCVVCKNKESLGLKSMRETFNQKYVSKFDYILQNTDISTWKFSCDIYYLDIRFSNLCNLSCRMCWSGASTWRSEIDKKLGRENYDQVFSELWDDDELFDANGPLQYLETIYIAGGEPFMDKTFIKFLHFLIDTGKSLYIVLKINTNLTILPQKYLKLLKKFKKVEFVASCDGYGKMYEYIRIWWKWDIFIKNLLTLIQFLPELWKWSKIDMNTVIQIDNIYNIPKLYLLCNKLGLRIILSMLHSPENMFIWNIPDNEKQKVIKLYQKYIEKYQENIPKISDDFWEIIHILQTTKQNSEQYNTFLWEKKIIDEHI